MYLSLHLPSLNEIKVKKHSDSNNHKYGNDYKYEKTKQLKYYRRNEDVKVTSAS